MEDLENKLVKRDSLESHLIKIIKENREELSNPTKNWDREQFAYIKGYTQCLEDLLVDVVDERLAEKHNRILVLLN